MFAVEGVLKVGK
jgi:hypothetical protein